MLTFEELCQLIRVVADNRVASVEVEKDGTRVRVEGVPVGWAGPGTVGEPLAALPTPGFASPETARVRPHVGAAPVHEENVNEGEHLVTSPIVGTFYRAPSPEAEPYVRTGDRVEKGQVLCIVEAMKLMNEIEADVSGVISRIFPENGQPVEYGQRLFALRSS